MTTYSGYSWGEFYETTSKCDGYSEEEKKKFAIFEALDEAKTFDEIRKIVKPLTEEQINWLNSQCLDGIIYSLKGLNPTQRLFFGQTFADTAKYYLAKKLIDPDYGLVTACFYGNTVLASVFLENGATRHKNTDSDQTLWYAYKNNNPSLFLLLLNYGTKIQERVFRYASEDNCVELVKIMLEKGMKENSEQLYLWEPLRTACEKGNTEIVQLFLDYGVNPTAHGFSPIFSACENGHHKIVKLLLDCKTSELNMHKQKQNLLRRAVTRSRISVIKVLLEYGADHTDIEIYDYMPQFYPEMKNFIDEYAYMIKNP